jgi:gluconate 2-dehydrogenase gamma chain
MGEALQHAHGAARKTAPRLVYLSVAEEAEIEAPAGEIIPTDESAGAKEAGAIYFIDRALATFDRDKRDLYRADLAAVQAKRRALFPDSESLTELTPAQRIATLETIEKTPVFHALREHAIIAFLPAPDGRESQQGWLDTYWLRR